MKKSLFLILLVALSGCHDIWDCTEGEGLVMSNTLHLDPISSISLSGSGTVYLEQGDVQEVIVEGQQNIVNELNENVKNGHWDIRLRRCTNNHKELVYYITIPEISGLEVIGSGEIIGTNIFETSEIEIKVTGSGNISADIETEILDLEITGSGRVDLTGEAGVAEVEVKGSGDLRAYDMIVDDCAVEIAGSGNVFITALETLKVKIAGSGDVNYKGNPSIYSTINGSGDLNNKN